MRDTTHRTMVAADSCWSRAEAQHGYAALSARLTMKTNMPPTPAQRADSGKPTADERDALGVFHRDWVTPCRTAMIHGLVAALPALQGSMLRYAEREDDVYEALVQGRLTWGDANSQLDGLRKEAADAMDEVGRQTEEGLHREHAQEMERRAAALSALGDALVQFGNQWTEAERRQRQMTSRQIMCQRVGAFLHCTTY